MPGYRFHRESFSPDLLTRLCGGPKPPEDDGPAEQAVQTDAHEPEPSARREPRRLTTWVEQTLAKALKVEKLERDEAGDFLFRMGSSLSVVRVIEDHSPRIEFFAPIVRDLRKTPALLEGLNEINLKLRFAKVALTAANEVILAAELLAWTVSERELLFMLNLVLNAADELDGKIRQRFGGRQIFQEEGEAVDV